MVKDGCKIIYSGRADEMHQEGVALMCSKEASKALLGYRPVSSRIVSARFQGRHINITVIQVYAPTTAAEEEEVDRFYEDLQSEVNQVARHDMLMIIGDWNAKVGKDWETWRGALGKFGYGKENERGERLLNFCLSNNMTVANTMFYKKKEKHYWTWESPDKTTKNQIDYIIVNRKWKTSVTACRSFPGPDIGSDHQLVLAGVHMKLKRMKTAPKTKRYDMDKLKDEGKQKEYEIKVGGRFNDLLKMNQSVKELWNNTKVILCETAEEVLGFKETRKKKPWISQEVLDLSDSRKKLKSKKGKDELLGKEYNKLTKEIHKKSRECKEKWLQEQCAELQDTAQQHGTGKVFKKVKLITGGGFSTKSLSLKDKEGKVLQSKHDIKGRWKEHFEELYNIQNMVDEQVLKEIPSTNSTQEEAMDFLEQEVRTAIKGLKPKKAPGIDNVTAEMIQAGGDSTVKVMHTLCNKILEEEIFPEDWEKAVIVPIHKKNDKRECSNYRGISLLSVPGKVFNKMIQQRLKQYVNNVVSEEQAGFRQGRGTIDQIFVIRQLAEKYTEHNKVLYNNFIDFKQAFDSVWQQGLWQVLRHYGIPEKMVRLLEKLYDRAVSAVRVDHELTEWFRTVVGVRQGCCLSPYLFNLILEAMMMQATKRIDTESVGIKMYGDMVSSLRFADDIDLLADTEENLQEITSAVHTASKQYGLKINTEKTKTMAISKKEKTLMINVGQQPVEQVGEFTYLGALITRDGACGEDIRRRIGKASAVVGRLGKIWRDKCISVSTKMQLYEVLVVSVFMYGAECWTLKKEDERRILAAEMNWLRRILTISRLERRRNEDIRHEVGQTITLVERIRKRRLQWLGHVERMNCDRLPVRALHTRIEGNRSRGRQRKRWIDNVKEDLEEKGINMQDASTLWKDRQKWTTLIQPHRQQPDGDPDGE
jgi:hypothetical protein